MLTELDVKGFRSFHHARLHLDRLNVVVGPNGVGKSNLAALFRMLVELSAGRLQPFIAAQGGADTLLFYGQPQAGHLDFTLTFQTEDTVPNIYAVSLVAGVDDALVFAAEMLTYRSPGQAEAQTEWIGTGQRESDLSQDEPKRRWFRHLLAQTRCYHFHDAKAPRKPGSVLGRSPVLLPQGENLAAVLYHLRDDEPLIYERIVKNLRLLAPFFDDFVLEPEGERILLRWREQRCPRVLGGALLSDGLVRSACLMALLLQPEEKLPKLLVIDEPELSLHPFALEMVASLIQKVSFATQVLVCTQSPALLDHFQLENVVVAERIDGKSVFKRLDAAAVSSWREDYTLGEVWRKNVIGGGPY